MKKPKGQVVNLTPKQRFLALYDSGQRNPQNIFKQMRRKIKISLSTVYNYFNKVQRGEDLLERKQRMDFGVTKAISKRKQQQIHKHVETNLQVSSLGIKKSLKLQASKSTINRFLHKNEYEFSNIVKTPMLTEFQKRSRVTFCRLHKNDRLENAVFVDESSFETHAHSAKTWSRKGQKKTVSVPKHPQKLHLFSGISLDVGARDVKR
ncbi:hypothetical protein ABPG72_020781 [Tetrahymena utriculariae]